MRITVFGATGRMGHLLVGQALDAGHAVTAYARSPERLRIGHPNLSVLAGWMSHDVGLEPTAQKYFVIAALYAAICVRTCASSSATVGAERGQPSGVRRQPTL